MYLGGRRKRARRRAESSISSISSDTTSPRNSLNSPLGSKSPLNPKASVFKIPDLNHIKLNESKTPPISPPMRQIPKQIPKLIPKQIPKLIRPKSSVTDVKIFKLLKHHDNIIDSNDYEYYWAVIHKLVLIESDKCKNDGYKIIPKCVQPLCPPHTLLRPPQIQMHPHLRPQLRPQISPFPIYYPNNYPQKPVSPRPAFKIKVPPGF